MNNQRPFPISWQFSKRTWWIFPACWKWSHWADYDAFFLGYHSFRHSRKISTTGCWPFTTKEKANPTPSHLLLFRTRVSDSRMLEHPREISWENTSIEARNSRVRNGSKTENLPKIETDVLIACYSIRNIVASIKRGMVKSSRGYHWHAQSSLNQFAVRGLSEVLYSWYEGRWSDRLCSQRSTHTSYKTLSLITQGRDRKIISHLILEDIGVIFK